MTTLIKMQILCRTLMDEFAFEKNRIEKLKEKYGDKLYQVKREPKYRYVYVIANKRKKKEIMNHKRFNVLKYPKGQNTNYDTSYKTTTQTELF